MTNFLPKSPFMQNPRFIAAKIIHQVIFFQQRFENAYSSAILHSHCPPQTQALIKAYCFGTLRWFIQLNHITNLLLHKPLSKKHHDLLCLICIGLYEIMHMNTPPYAIVNDTVNAAANLHKPWAKGLINKTLKQFIEKQPDILKKISGIAEVLYAHPPWLVALFKEAWPTHWQEILKANNHQAPMFLRVNLLQTSVSAYQKLLTHHHLESATVENCPTAVKLTTPCNVDKLPGFQAGLCSVQDIAGQYVAQLLQLQPGQIILDACAAPGSKTCHLIEHEPQLTKIVAIDNQETRLKHVYENINRLKLPLNKFQLLIEDATQPDNWWNGQLFDRILLDAPCSATGVIRRHPDIKFLRLAKDINQYTQKQIMLLNKLWPLLKTNGYLLYTTCSVLPQENEQVAAHFVKNHHNAKVELINVNHALSLPYGKQLLPTENGSDGFYYVLFKKEM